MHENLALATVDRALDQDVFVDAVVVVQIVRAHLIEPACFASPRVAREHARRPFIVARALRRIPRPGIGRSVIDELLLAVVRDPTPHGAAARLPRFGRPCRDTEILTAVGCIKRLERRTNQDLAIGSRAVRAPDFLPGLHIERREPAPYAEL